MFKPMKPLFSLPSNHSIVIKSAGSNQTSSDAGALLMRQVIDRTGIIEFLQDRLYDDRDPNRVKECLINAKLIANPVQKGFSGASGVRFWSEFW